MSRQESRFVALVLLGCSLMFAAAYVEKTYRPKTAIQFVRSAR